MAGDMEMLVVALERERARRQRRLLLAQERLATAQRELAAVQAAIRQYRRVHPLERKSEGKHEEEANVLEF